MHEQGPDVCSTKVVSVPLDVMIKYHERAQRISLRMLDDAPEEAVLQWLVARDEEERSLWADISGTAQKPLGLL